MSTVLLTGATGAIGSLLLDTLSARDDVARVYALVHEQPLQPTSPKVRVLAGDIRQGDDGRLLGLAPSDAEELAGSVTRILHAAADTRFTASPAALRATNVDGLRNVLRLAERCRRLDRVCALSSVYVAGKRTGVILEPELHHDAGFVNAYEASKYDAELELRDWMDRLPIGIVRLSTAIGDSRTGRVRRLAAIHHAIRLMYRSLAPMVPGRAEYPVDLVPLDYAVSAIAHLFADAFEPGRTVHVCGGCDTLTASELLDLTFGAFAEHRPAWRKRAIERPALVDLETFELFRRTVEEVGDSALRDSTAIVGSFAPQLGYPKRFDDAGCQEALRLPTNGIERPSARNTYVRTIQYLLESDWGRREVREGDEEHDRRA